MREVVSPKATIKHRIGGTLDGLASIVSPEWGRQRRNARTMARIQEIMGDRQIHRFSSGGYRSGKSRVSHPGRLMGTGGSADEDIIWDLPELRSKSRNAWRDNPIAHGIVESKVKNVIQTGIRPQAYIDHTSLGIDADRTRQLCRDQERWFARWSDFSDAAGRLNYYQLQQTLYRQKEINGDEVILRVYIEDPYRPTPLALLPVEADRLENPRGMSTNPNMRDGVEIDEWGRPIAYHIRDTHPGDTIYAKRKSAEWMRVPARTSGIPNVLHVARFERTGQSRGVPTLATSLERLADVDDYLEAEIQGAMAVASICWKRTISNLDDIGFSGLESPFTDSAGTTIEDVTPASIFNLLPGEDMEVVSAQRPGVTFDPFLKVLHRILATGSNLNYESVSGDYSEANYSNLRGALLEARRYFQMEQSWMIDVFCRPVWEMVIEDGYLRGEWGTDISPAEYFLNRQFYLRSRHIPKGWQWVDPKNEATATEVALRNRLTTYSHEWSTRGEDWEEMFDQIEIEQAMLAEKGLSVSVGAETPVSNEEGEGE